MITVRPFLRVGNLKAPGMGGFVIRDSYDFVIKNCRDPYAVDNVNSILHSTHSDNNYAELRLYVTGNPFEGFLLGSFQKIKVGKKYKWVLTP